MNLPHSAFRISIRISMGLFMPQMLDRGRSQTAHRYSPEQSTWGAEHVSLLRLQLRNHRLIRVA
jgi:hypothetical protein